MLALTSNERIHQQVKSLAYIYIVSLKYAILMAPGKSCANFKDALRTPTGETIRVDIYADEARCVKVRLCFVEVCGDDGECTQL